MHTKEFGLKGKSKGKIFGNLLPAAYKSLLIPSSMKMHTQHSSDEKMKSTKIQPEMNSVSIVLENSPFQCKLL